MPFKKPSSGGFGKMPSKEDKGSYLAEVVDIVQGPTFTDQRTGDPKPTMAWVWRLFLQTGEPFIDADADPPAQFIATTFTNETMAQKSSSRKFFAAILGRDIDDGEDPDALIADAKTRRAFLQFGIGETKKVKLSAVSGFEGENTLTDEERVTIVADLGTPGDYTDGKSSGDAAASPAGGAPPKVDPAKVREAAIKAQEMADAAGDAAAAEDDDA